MVSCDSEKVTALSSELVQAQGGVTDLAVA